MKYKKQQFGYCFYVYGWDIWIQKKTKKNVCARQIKQSQKKPIILTDQNFLQLKKKSVWNIGCRNNEDR